MDGRDVAADGILIETNVLNVAANTVLIATNTLDIAANDVLIATNTVNISARDGLVTDINEKVGLMSFLSTPSNTTCTTSGAWYPVAGVFSNKVMSGFVQTGIVYTCTSAITNWYKIDWAATLATDSASTTVHIGILKAGDVDYCCIQATLCKTATEEYVISGSTSFKLTSGDEINLEVSTDGDEDVLTFEHATMVVSKLFPVRE